MSFGVKVVFVVGDTELLGQGVCALLRHDCGSQHDHVSFDLDLDADGDVAPHDDDLVAFLVEAGDRAADVDGFFLFDGSAPEFVVAFAGGTGVHEEDVGLAVVDFMVVEHGVLGGVHAADFGAVGDPFFSGTRADALYEDDLFRLLAVGGAQNLAAGRAGGRCQTLEGHAVDDVGDLAVTEFAVPFDLRAFGLFADVVEVEAGGDDDGTDRFDDQLVLLLEVYGAWTADFLADAAFTGFEHGAVFAVDDRGVGYGLGKGDVDGRTHADVAVEFVGDLFLGAFGHADAAAGAFVFIDGAGPFLDRDLEVADVTFDEFDLGVGVELDLGVVGNVDHFGGHDALGTVQGREGLGELGHVAADGGLALDQDDFVAAVGDVEGRLDAGDAAADDEGSLGDRYGDGRKDAVLLDPLDHHADDLGSLDGGFFPVLMNPGAMFTDVGHFAEEWVQAGRFDGFTEGALVHARGTGRDDYVGEFLLLDGFLEQVLAGIGAHIFVVGGEGDAGHLADFLCNPLNIDGSGYVFAAVADEYAYS